MSDLQNLSDDELKALHLSTLSDDELKALYQQHAPSWGDTALDTAKSFGSKFVNALTGFVPGMVQGGQTLENIYRKEMGAPQKEITQFPNVEKLQQATAHEPQTGFGEAGGRIGEFVGNPASYVGGPETLAAKGLAAALSGGGSYLGEKGVNALVGTNGGPIGSLAGALAGGALAPNAAVGRYANQVRKVASEIGPQNLSAGDVTGNKTVRAFESELSPRFNEKQDQAVKQAAFNRVGEVIGDRDIEGQGGVVDTMLSRTGRAFDELQARNHAVIDQGLINDLGQVSNTFNSAPGLYGTETTNSINAALDRVKNVMSKGYATGDEYQTLRSNLSRAARGATDPQRAEGLHDIVNALDDTMERTVQRTNPADAGAWAKARRDYTNALVLERWANSGSANMTPASLARSAKAVYGKRQYLRGFDDFSDFAEPARNVLTQFPDSGTARRQVAEKAATGLGLAIGGGLGVAGGQYINSEATGSSDPVIPFLAGEGALGAILGRPLLKYGTMNPATQYLLKKGLTPGGPDMGTRLARALGQVAPQAERLYVSPNNQP